MGRGSPRRAAAPGRTTGVSASFAGWRHEYSRLRAALTATTLTLLTFGSAAHADDLDDFLEGRDAYVSGEYARATRELTELVGRPTTPALAVVLPAARRYLAASLYADRREADARAMVTEILRENPRTRLDPTQFDAGFVRLFNSVVQSSQSTLDRLITDQAIARRQQEIDRDARRTLAMRLLTEQSTTEIVPRWQAFVPFGVGQFANRQNGLGALFLSLETTFLLGSVATVIVDQAIASPTQPAGSFAQGTDDQRAALATVMRALNWTSVSALAATIIAGVIQANVAYVPARVVTTPRPLAPVLQGIQISSLPGGAALSLGGTF